MSDKIEKKDLLNEAYESVLATTGVVVLSMASKRILGEKLTDATTLKDTAKLAVAVTLSTIAVKYTQDKKWIPTNPFKMG